MYVYLVYHVGCVVVRRIIYLFTKIESPHGDSEVKRLEVFSR